MNIAYYFTFKLPVCHITHCIVITQCTMDMVMCGTKMKYTEGSKCTIFYHRQWFYFSQFIFDNVDLQDNFGGKETPQIIMFLILTK